MVKITEINPKLEKTFELTLSYDEIKVLQSILGMIGGNPNGPRSLIDVLHAALENATDSKTYEGLKQ